MDLSGLVSDAGTTAADAEDGEATVVPVEVNGKKFDVKLYCPRGRRPRPPAGAAVPPAGRQGRSRPRHRSGGSGTITAPMQGTIVKVTVEVGQAV